MLIVFRELFKGKIEMFKTHFIKILLACSYSCDLK